MKLFYRFELSRRALFAALAAIPIAVAGSGSTAQAPYSRPSFARPAATTQLGGGMRARYPNLYPNIPTCHIID